MTHDPYEPWAGGPKEWAGGLRQMTVLELPPAVMQRLTARAKAAGFQNDAGQPDIVHLLWQACEAHAGFVCDFGLDAIATDDTDPDLQMLRIAAVRGSMERDRAN